VERRIRMINELEDTLIEMCNQLMKLEDSALQTEEYLEAKKFFLVGVIRQVDVELQVLNMEYDVLGVSLAEELEELALFERSREAYDIVMGSMFKH
jgi:hypothetical protein